MKKYSFASCIFFSLICACQAYQTIPIQYSRIPLQPGKNGSDSIARMLKNYRKTVTDSLQNTIAFSNHPWLNKAPEYALANLLADGIWNAVSKQDSTVAGVLMPATIVQGYWPRGNITSLQLYQLLPENKIWGTIAIQGAKLSELLKKLIEAGGWTASQNIQVVTKTHQELAIALSGRPLQMDTSYKLVIVIADAYSCGKERFVPTDFYWGKGTLSNMLMDYCISFTQKGKPLPLLQEKRMYAGDE